MAAMISPCVTFCCSMLRASPLSLTASVPFSTACFLAASILACCRLCLAVGAAEVEELVEVVGAVVVLVVVVDELLDDD